MELNDSNMSCGVYELDGLGENPKECAYREVMRHCHAAIVLASVPAAWRNTIKFLNDKGFKQLLRKSRNPNSGNDIVLLARNFTEKQRAKLYKARALCRCYNCHKTPKQCRCGYFECSKCCGGGEY